MEEIFTEYLLPLTIYLTPITAILALGGSLLSMARDPKKAVQSLIGVAVLVALFFIGYSMADSSVTTKQVEEFNMTEDISKMVGGTLYMLYGMFGITIAVVIWNSIAKIIK